MDEILQGTENRQMPTQIQNVEDARGLAYNEANKNQDMAEYKAIATDALMTGKATPAQVIQSGMMTADEVRGVMDMLRQASSQDGGLAARGMAR